MTEFLKFWPARGAKYQRTSVKGDGTEFRATAGLMVEVVSTGLAVRIKVEGAPNSDSFVVAGKYFTTEFFKL